MKIITFPVQLSREFDPLILGGRIAVASLIRKLATDSMVRAREAGVDEYTAGMRLTQSWQAAVGASKFLRSFPPALVRWAMRVDNEARVNEAYPAAPADTVGGYGPRWVTVMPANAVMIAAGGVRAIGQAPEAFQARLVQEVRLTNAGDSWTATLLVSEDAGHGELEPEPDDAEMEREDA